MPVVFWVTPTAWQKLHAGHFKFHSTAHNKKGPGSRQGPFLVLATEQMAGSGGHMKMDWFAACDEA